MGMGNCIDNSEYYYCIPKNSESTQIYQNLSIPVCLSNLTNKNDLLTSTLTISVQNGSRSSDL